MSDRALLKETQWRQCAYQAFASGLRRYLTRSVINSRPELGQFEAMSEVEAMIRSGEVGSQEKTVMDVAESKWLVWKRAVQLLETILFSTKIK